jgi:hypothetical protein
MAIKSIIFIVVYPLHGEIIAAEYTLFLTSRQMLTESEPDLFYRLTKALNMPALKDKSSFG